MNKKRILTLVLALVFIVALFAGCAGNTGTTGGGTTENSGTAENSGSASGGSTSGSSSSGSSSSGSSAEPSGGSSETGNLSEIGDGTVPLDLNPGAAEPVPENPPAAESTGVTETQTAPATGAGTEAADGTIQE
jgi:hypothetical protein